MQQRLWTFRIPTVTYLYFLVKLSLLLVELNEDSRIFVFLWDLNFRKLAAKGKNIYNIYIAQEYFWHMCKRGFEPLGFRQLETYLYFLVWLSLLSSSGAQLLVELNEDSRIFVVLYESSRTWWCDGGSLCCTWCGCEEIVLNWRHDAFFSVLPTGESENPT